jgi:hypothetical protein
VAVIKKPRVILRECRHPINVVILSEAKDLLFTTYKKQILRLRLRMTKAAPEDDKGRA